MPRYFFHTVDGGRDVDQEGTELPNDAAARKAAIRFAGAVMHDEPDVLWDGRDYRVEVTNETGALLFTIVMLSIDAPASNRA
ncbi:DUF6894 family protein [Sphingobium indicum]|uniref:DUF6894 family protein n=1 Tax=Sphingobium indicum TaxID=332055 RepID=UPI00055D8845|nr:hypothetical protein [Sphingobium indicum]